MTHAQAAYRAGCIASELEARGYAGEDGLTPTALSNAARQPDKIGVFFRHALPKAVAARDAVIEELMGDFHPPTTPYPTAEQSCFWGGYYHQKTARGLPADFPARLTALRTAAGLDVNELAKLAGLTRAAVYKLEAGESRPTWATVQSLAKALGTTTDVFRDPPK